MMTKYILLLFTVILLSCNKKDEQVKTNVIYILADDLGYGDLSCLGQEKLQTPNIDRLASEGMTFLNHYSGNTVCSPSRAVLLTGQDPGHVHCRGNRGYRYLDSTMVTLPRLFKNAGYKTGAFGKWGLGTTHGNGLANPQTHGFDEFYGPRTQTSAHNYFTNRLVHNGEVIPVNEKDYMHTLIMEQVLDFIKRSASEDKPFFCYIPTPIPHAAMHAPKELHDKWRKIYPEFDSVIGKYNAGKDEKCADVVNPIAGFAAMMELLDSDVGRILATVKELGIDENTIIMFSSDNGSHHEGGHDPEFWNSNGPFRGHKRDLYEGGIHAPFLVRWPQVVKPGSQSELISAFWDILPTMAEVLNLPIPAQVDGLSFLPTLTGNEKTQKKHEYLFFEFNRGSDENIVSQALRMEDWKAVRGGDNTTKEDRTAPFKYWPIELYNLSSDIGEENNVAEEHPELIERLKHVFNEARVDISTVR